MSTVARRWGRAAAIVVVVVLGCGALSTGNTPTERSAERSVATDPAAAAQPLPRQDSAPVSTQQTKLNYVYSVEDTATTIKKFGSKMTFPTGTFHAVLLGLSSTGAPMKGTLKLPSTEAYFLAFGFMPVTSTVTLQPTGEFNASGTVWVNLPTARIETEISFYIKLSDVRVDGVPLNVGPHCRTIDPVRVQISGIVSLLANSEPYPLEATYTIPPFSGCGVTEDLDPLITGLVSGPGNTLSTKLRVRCTAGKYPCEEG